MVDTLNTCFEKIEKETIRNRTTRTGTVLKKEADKKQIGARTPTPQSNASIFGSLRRGQGGIATSTPRGTPTAANLNDATKIRLRDKPPDKERKPWFRSANIKKEPIKASSASLNGNNIQKSTNAPEVKKKRPIAVSALSTNVTVRRGQNPKIDGQNLPDNLSRASSVTNLDVEQKINNKGAKPRKSASRDRIDKIGESKRNDNKKAVTKNNNKLESGDSPYPSIDSLQEEEFLQLRRQLQEMAQEKSNLALQLGEQKGQLNILQKEIQKLKEESNMQLEHLTEENTALRNRLRDVAHSPLSDNEKQQLLYESHRHHSSAPASIATNLGDEANGGDITACPTPDWDKHSSSNVSEVSVACLQDKINQMQETHYSTNEELQATLQELTDLQRQLTELQQENERLNEEKTLMFDSLCRQTERLNDSRSEVESLKQLLYREKDETGQYESAVEREQKLLELLKSAQEERETLLTKLEQINNEIQETRAGILEKDERIMQLSERVRTLESTLDAKHAEHKLLDQELAQAKDQCSARQIEINRLTDLLDNARTKIIELEQDRALSDKSELDELLDNARKEKDALESEVAHLKEQLAISKNEIEKLKEQVSVLQEECKVTRNNARTTQSDLEYKCEKLVKEKTALNDQLQEFQEAVNELQVQSQCQLEDKRQLSAVLSETQRNLSEAERKNLNMESELQELKKLRAEENEEWEKFQSDLLTSVRVANDFKTEAQQELQRMILENKALRDKERQLKAEIDKLKGDDIKKGESAGTNSTRPKLSNKENVPSKDMDSLLKLSRKNKDRPRKSKDTTDTSSSGSKGDKSRDKAPDVFSKMVKRREKKPGTSKKNKTLSVEEELLMRSLNDWYEHIDKNVPEDKLTEEEKVVRKLKTLYEDEGIKEKPVAHKPKDQLAISKPLLDSVFLNPKLEEIAKDPNVPTIEEIGKSEVLSHDSPELRRLPDKIERESRVQSDNFGLVDKDKRLSIISRSKSLDDLYTLDEKGKKTILYRSNETEDLRNQIDLKRVERESSILPSDSVSNPRYSDFTLVVNSEENLNTVPEKSLNTKVARNSSVNHETLELILVSIPINTPEPLLTSEQRFALRLKKALDEAERKNTLKKQKRDKKLVISSPLAESVRKNPGLRDVLLDPRIKSVQKRRNSESEDKNISPLDNKTIRESKSYQDIRFTFEAPPNKQNFNSNDSTGEDSHTSVTENVSVRESFSDEEVNIDTINTRFKNIRDSIELPYNKGDFKDGANLKSAEDEEPDSLTYNETLKKNRISGNNDKSVQEKLVVHVDIPGKVNRVIDIYPWDSDLLYNETLKKNHEFGEQFVESDPNTAGNINRKTTTDQDLDINYNEPLNRNTELCVNTDNDNKQEAVESDTDYKVIKDFDKVSKQYTELKHQQPLEKHNNPQEIIDEGEILCKEIINEPEKLTDTESKNLIYVESVNKEVKLPNSEIHFEHKIFEQQSPNFQIAKEIVVVKKVEYHPVDLEVLNKDVTTGSGENIAQSLDTQIPELHDFHNKINDNFSKVHIDVSSDIVDNDLDTEENDEYNYQAILKENRFGVTSPLNIRLVYKDVVNEIKHKFPHDDDIKEVAIDEDTDDEFEQSNTFFDDFFGVKPKVEHTMDDDTNNINEIDKEMEEIFEKYLHTPLSKVITQIDEEEDKPNTSTKLENSKKNEETKESLDDKRTTRSTLIDTSPPASMIAAVKNDEHVMEDEIDFPPALNQTIKADSGDSTQDKLWNETAKDENNGENNEQSLEEIMLIIDDSHRNLQEEDNGAQTSGDLMEVNDNSLEIVSIIVDEKVDDLKNGNSALDDNISTSSQRDDSKDFTILVDEVAAEDHHSNNEKLTTDNVLSGDIDEEVVLTDKLEKQLPDIVESVNESLVYDNIGKKESPSKDHSENELTPAEQKLLKSIRKERFSRPLSDFGEKDLMLIREISTRYLPETSETSEPNENDKKENLVKSVLPTSLENQFSAVENLSENEIPNQDQANIAERDRDRPNKDIKRDMDIGIKKIPHVEFKSPDTNKGKKRDEMRRTNPEHDDDLDAILTRMVAPRSISNRRAKRKSIRTEESDSRDNKAGIENMQINKTSWNPPTETPYNKDRVHLDKSEHPITSKAMVQKEENLPTSPLALIQNKDSELQSYKELAPSEIAGNTDMKHSEKGKTSEEAIISLPKFIPDTAVEQEESILNVVERKTSNLDVFLAKPVILEYTPILSNAIKVDEVDNIAYIEYGQQTCQSNDFKSNDTDTVDSKESNKLGIQDQTSIGEEKYKVPPFLTPYRDLKGLRGNDSDLYTSHMVMDNRESNTNLPKRDENKILPENIESNQNNVGDLNKIFERTNILLRSFNTPRDSVYASNKNLREERPVLSDTLRRDYKGIKDKLDYFSKTHEPPSYRQSFRAYPGRSGLDERKVKSWAEHFERRSLDTHSYEPVYANFSSLISARITPPAKGKIDKKPLPIPRSKNQNSHLDTNDISEPFVKNDTSLKESKMSDPKNFSENVAKDIMQEVTANVFEKVMGAENVGMKPDVSGNEVPKSLGAAKLFEDDKTFIIGQKVGIKKAEKFLDVPSDDDVKTAEDDGQINYVYGAESSFSAIAVAGKVEQLDITKHSQLDIEEMDANNQSKLNLFHIETPSYDESYLNLFKQPEDKVYDDITGLKKPQRGFFNIAYLGEVSDNDSSDDLLRNKPQNMPNLGEPKSKPKIIDFVPLDDATKPVYKKNTITVPDYDTLEREKTFHILNSAPSTVKVKSFSKVEGSKSSLSSGSSFSAAKKVFEALLEANSEKNVEKPKIIKKRESVFELTGKLEMRRSSSSVGLVDKRKMEENVDK